MFYPPEDDSFGTLCSWLNTEHSMAVHFSVSTITGVTYDIFCTKEDTVQSIREQLEEHHIEVLCDQISVTELDPSQPIFAVVARETKVEILLQAAGSYQGYKDLIKAAPSSPEGENIKVMKGLPSILAVLEDMGGQQPDVKDLRQGEHGELLMTGELGHLLLPSLSVEALQPPSADTAAEASGQRELQRELQPFTKVIFSVQLNSDAYNQGLGIVLEQPPSMQCEMDRNGIPTYIYNGWGLSKDKNSNAIKFHPGMERGELRVEGPGGFPNSDMGFTPQNWTQSNSFHTFQVTIGTDGRNQLKVTGTRGEVFEAVWRNKLTDGVFMPALHAWLDSGGGPLLIGDIVAEIHFPAA
ncbi:unnamed protein product [Durusdinium trenchii]|uniref:Uncharacterized protein n=2 Tax=Durusdinium trenchii TaxID=1381693 RepID=A0ABP0P813_9DINO